MLDLICQPFDRLTVRQLHDLLELRCQVFIVEQNCAYDDIDGHDPESVHLLAYDGETLEGCCRWYPRDPQVVFGRIVTSQRTRGQGLGSYLMAEALDRIGPTEIFLSAQAHLEPFYRRFGFIPQGEPYDDVGILHVHMVRVAPLPTPE
ncbi:MAG: GNAT family N-acetyltransferase [Acidobacteriota bacterium]|nr:GNAT family N-acetyltransferase [Acidobacteriota bacterium]